MKKKKLLSILSVLLVALTFLGTFPVIAQAPQAVYAEEKTVWENPYEGSYYDNLNTTLVGNAFRAQVAQLITSTHNTSVNSYDNLKTQFPITDANPETGTGMLWFYTGTEVSGYTGNSNREHVWPKDGGDAFPEKTGPGCDLQHLRPTDAQLNSTRGSNSFDELPTTAKQANENGKPSGCYYGNGFFYPAAGYRGATARILMYVQTRWGDRWSLSFVDAAGKCKTIGKISTLLKWHLEEPPTAAEIYRNQKAFEIQGNRNPFIDHPEYAAQIYCYDGNSYNKALQDVLANSNDPYNNLGGATNVQLKSLAIVPNDVTLAFGETQLLAVAAQPTGANSLVSWTISNSNVATISPDGTVTAKSVGTTYVRATSIINKSVSATARIIVKQIGEISVSGVPQTVNYTEGLSFKPQGLTVTATYTDGSTAPIRTDQCTWLDANTLTTNLYQGTTLVVCKYGELMCQVPTAITVGAYQGCVQAVVTRNSFDATNDYGFHPWAVDELQGIAYIYGAKKDVMQFNNKQDHCYVTNTTSADGGLRKITVKGNKDAKDWTLFTSNEPYGVATARYPETGTNRGKKTVTTAGVTWELNCDDVYFALCYTDSGAAYLDSITIEYGIDGSGSAGVPTPDDTVALDKSYSLAKPGDAVNVKAVSTSAPVWTTSDSSVATVENGVVRAVGLGTATITVTVGSAKATFILEVTETGEYVPPEPEKEPLFVTPDSATLEIGDKVTLSANLEVSWSSSDPSVATVSPGGLVTAVGAGRVEITVTSGEQVAICVITVVVDHTVYDFESAMQQLQNATTHRQKYDALTQAWSLYNTMNGDQKQKVANLYETLVSATDAYNGNVEKQNVDVMDALRLGAMSLVAVALATWAIIAIISREE